MGGSLAHARTGTAVAVARAEALGYLRKVPSDRVTPVVVPERFNAAAFFLDRHRAEGRGGRTAFRFAGRAVTYEEVGRRANQLGNALRARGVGVEAALVEHPAVLEAAVIGRADGDGLTRPHAFCVLRDGADGDDALRDALRATVKERLAGYKAPRWIEFVADLPKTSTGKIQRFRLRE